MPPKKTKTSSGIKRNRNGEESAAAETGALLSPNRHGAGANSDNEDSGAARGSKSKSPSKGHKSAASPSQKSQGSSRGSKKAAKNDGESVANHPLLELLSSGASMTTTVDDLISLYQSDPNAAVAVLVTTICRASGAPDTVTVDSDAIVDKDSIVATLEEVFARIPTDATAMTYLLINKDVKYRRFKKAFPEFFEKFIVAATDSILDDGILLDLLTNWLSAMGESKARSFRHTASTAMFAILNGLVERLHAANEALSLSRSKKEVASLQKKKDRISVHFDDVFKYSIQPRSKDVAPEIRQSALSSLRNWIVSYPDLFLENKRLIYFVDALHDKRPEVRSEVLECLVQLLGDSHENVEKLHDFLRKYAPRITEMAQDLDTRVANLALKVCALIVKAEHDTGATEENGQQILKNEMMDQILLSLMDDRLVIRNTAGILLKVFINCRTASEDEVDSIDQRATVLSNFCRTLRKEFAEPWAERYLVDAVWNDANPPPMLTDFKPYINLAVTTEEPVYCATLLRMLAATLDRCSGPLQLGPAAKDDLKSDAKKSKTFDFEGTKRKISTELLSSMGKLHLMAESDDVIDGVCRVLHHADLSVLSQDRLAARFKDVVANLVKSTLTTTSKTLLKTLMETWPILAFNQHPQKKAAEDGLQDVVTSVLGQLTKIDKASVKRSRTASQANTEEQEKEHTHVWNRIAAVTSLLALPDQLPIFKHDLMKHLNNKAGPLLLTPLIDSCYATVLWYVGQKQSDVTMSDDDVSNTIGEIITTLLKVAKIDSETGADVLQLRVTAIVYVCDLVNLPYCNLPAAEQNELLSLVNQISEGCNGVVELCHDSLKKNLRLVGAPGGNVAQRTRNVTYSKKAVTAWEANCTKLATGVGRLFTYQRVDEAKAPYALLQWTKRGATKQAADLYKGLFHTVRDRATNAAEFEQDILAAALEECKEVGGMNNSQGMEAFYAMGQKLSSIHFVPMDKHYPDVVSIVKWGMEYAANQDPLILHAVSPFCTRLRVPDALSIANSVANSDFFSTISEDGNSGADIAARSFIASLRRAAKLEEPAARGASKFGVTPAASGTRGRTGRRTAPEEDGVLAGIVGSVMADSTGGGASAGKKKVAHTDGWRSRGGAQSQQTAGGGTQKITQTQQSAGAESGISGLLDMDSEQFIATQEWN